MQRRAERGSTVGKSLRHCVHAIDACGVNAVRADEQAASLALPEADPPIVLGDDAATSLAVIVERAGARHGRWGARVCGGTRLELACAPEVIGRCGAARLADERVVNAVRRPRRRAVARFVAVDADIVARREHEDE